MTDSELAMIRRRQAIRLRWLADPAMSRKLSPDVVQAAHDIGCLLTHLDQSTDGNDPARSE